MIILPSKEDSEIHHNQYDDLGLEIDDDDIQVNPFHKSRNNQGIVPKILRSNNGNGENDSSNETIKAANNNIDFTNGDILANQSQYSATNLLMMNHPHQNHIEEDDDLNKEGDTSIIRLVDGGSSILN